LPANLKTRQDVFNIDAWHALQRLGPRQKEMLRRIADSETTKGIALDLKLSPKTVEHHRMQLMKRVNIFDVAGLVRFAIRAGLILPVLVACGLVRGMSADVPPAPPALAVSNRPTVYTWYFSATATATNGLESDFSNEVSVSVTNARALVELAWETVTNRGATYTVYTGFAPRTYTNATPAGTNTRATVQVGRPIPPVIYRLWAEQATNRAGPWSAITNWPALVWTNAAPAAAVYRVAAAGTGGSRTVTAQRRAAVAGGAWSNYTNWPAMTQPSGRYYRLATARGR
jgi:DNA-binding CsgD family transcriptional regulator